MLRPLTSSPTAAWAEAYINLTHRCGYLRDGCTGGGGTGGAASPQRAATVTAASKMGVARKRMMKPGVARVAASNTLILGSKLPRDRRIGYCDRTVQSGDANAGCAEGDKGSWPLAIKGDQEGLHTLNDCITRCQRCNRCRYVSASLRHNDCSWFHRCNMSALRKDVSNFWTVGVKDHTLANASAQ